jgi:hypothetical protein
MWAWFATWLVLGPALLQAIGQPGAAHSMVEWRGIVIPSSAALLHYLLHRTMTPIVHALSAAAIRDQSSINRAAATRLPAGS